MYIPEGLMYKKIKLWLALLIIAIIALIAAFGISAKAATSYSRGASSRLTVGTSGKTATASLYFGGQILITKLCTTSTYYCPCSSGFYFVIIKPANLGSAISFCYNDAIPRFGVPPAPGLKVMGIGIPTGVTAIPIIFGVSQ